MLNKKKLESNLLKHFKSFRSNPTDAAKSLANIIDDYVNGALVKSGGTVTIPTGQIQVTGTTGISTNLQPIVIKNIKNKGQLK